MLFGNTSLPIMKHPLQHDYQHAPLDTYQQHQQIHGSPPLSNNKNKNKYEGQTKNLLALVRITGSGDLFAIPYPHKKTGYKSRYSYGFRPVFQDETTNSSFQNAVVKNSTPGQRKDKLVPYHPNASCNRSRETYKNVIGRRCNDCRNASYIRLYDGFPKHLKTPKTTNQLFMHYKLDPVGNANQAIFSDKAKRMHRLQCEG